MKIAQLDTDLQDIDFQEGCMIPIDKDAGWTSFDVVNKLRQNLPVKKVGHAGTLDPLATGLVLICTGKYTKKLNDLMYQEKEYTGTITFGQTTPSFDLETPLEDSGDYTTIDPSAIQDAAKEFIGIIDQVPPIFSAIKINGQRAYKKARKNEEAQLQARQVEIKNFEIVEIGLPDVTFKLQCSKGTYVRSLAHDLGQKLSVGAHLSSLRRTAIGNYRVENAWNIQNFVSAYRKSEVL